MSDTISTYRTIHWGDNPTHQEDVRVLSNCTAKPLVQIKAISYVTSKKGKPEIYRHAFERVDGEYPWLLQGVPKGGEYRIPSVTGELTALGRVIDIETCDKQRPRIFPSFYWVATTDRLPGPVLLASRFDPELAIEHRKGKPYIEKHGIMY